MRIYAIDAHKQYSIIQDYVAFAYFQKDRRNLQPSPFLIARLN